MLRLNRKQSEQMTNPTTIKPTSASESARIALEIRGRLEDDNIVIAVEGDDDVRIDRKLFKKGIVFVPMQGKVKLLNIDKELFDAYPRNLIAIKDADFDNLNGTTTPHRNIFLTDKHDMEMTMVDDEIVESIISENIPSSDEIYSLCNGHELIRELCENLKCYSYIKWFNDSEDCSINFDVVNMKALNVAQKAVSLKDALDKIYEYEANNRTEIRKVTGDEVSAFIDHHPCEDLLQLVCVHDFCSTLIEWMRVHGAKGNLKRSGLEGLIRIQYNSTKFRKSSLYEDIHFWETKYGRSIVA